MGTQVTLRLEFCYFVKYRTYISYYSRESLQAEFDEQVLRLTEMEQQLNYKRDECEV